MDLPEVGTLVLSLFALAFVSDVARGIFEMAVNFYFKGRRRSTTVLDPDEVAIVIPCHDSGGSIESTVRALPECYPVYCVANNCTDETVEIIESLGWFRPNLQLIDVDYPGKSKTKAVLLGALKAASDGFTHFLLLDDDVRWPSERIEVRDKRVAVTAVPVIPERPVSLLERLQVFEYISTNLNKRCQTFFARDVTWASGAAAIYRCDVFLEVMRLHDGEFAGEDVQCSYLHHYMGHKIDFLLEMVVTTDIPRSPSEWWRQRAHSWDVSFMFLHLGLLLRVIFRAPGRGPGVWIRLLTFYRVYDSCLVLIKLGIPFAVLQAPTAALLFLSSSYLILAVHFLSYPLFFTVVDRPRRVLDFTRVAVAFIVFPAYQFATWVSRLFALPRAIHLIRHRRPPLGKFIDENFAACSRVNLPSLSAANGLQRSVRGNLESPSPSGTVITARSLP